MIRFGTVCSGIGAPELAWQALGWLSVFASEIEAFPRAVLRHHWPDTALHGDFTTIKADQYGPIDVLCGGTPCQSFSVAGLRGGMADERGNLALEFLRLADRLRPRWVVWENVPGVLSSAGGRDFGAFLGGVAECGYGWAYRVLDAQHFGLAQRRKRVFVVGCAGDWRPAAAVLFEPASLRGNSAPRREKGEGVAPTLAARTRGGGGLGTDFECDGGLQVARCLTSHSGQLDGETETFLPVAFGWQNSPSQGDSVSTHHTPTLDKSKTPAVAFDINQIANPIHSPRLMPGAPCGTLGSQNRHGVAFAAAVRRLTPRECERLQGFPDDYTAIPYRNGIAADGPRYKALGNSMAVPVMRWIGARIALVNAQMMREAA